MNLERERGVFMLTNETIALMEELTQAVGISGDERNISKIMKTHMGPMLMKLYTIIWVLSSP